MPIIKGRLTYKGYTSPAPGKLDKENKQYLAKIYGSCRTKNPGEIPSRKTKCAKIAWNTVNKKLKKY